MAKDVCFNGTMANTDKYSSPIPLVGLYIAVASMVCALLILCDVWAGLKRKMWWFPCRFFSINSVTLTLVSIAAKIPVDLTTNMPSKQDQLSKLAGTVFICVCMIFMRPSISISAEFESYANVIALSIFVITVVVNVCIQLTTGVIFIFIPEHVIILICMLMLLLWFWYSVVQINALKSKRTDKGIELIKKGEESMLARLKLCYIYGYHSCSQLSACLRSDFGDTSAVCIMCSAVLVQATVRSLALKEFKFCEGVSDYGWSMWWVVASQIFIVAVVSCSIGGRWLIGLTSNSHVMGEEAGYNETYIQFQYLLSLRNIPKSVEKIFKYVIYSPLYLFHVVLWVLILICELVVAMAFIAVCRYILRIGIDSNILDEKSKAFVEHLKRRQVAVENWVVKKGTRDMERWMAINEQVSLKHLACLLSTVPPSREAPYYVGLNGEGIRISLISLMLLVEAAKYLKAKIHPDGKVYLVNMVDEVFEIIHFIENKVNCGSSYDRLKSMLSKVIHKYGFTKRLGECASNDSVITCINKETSLLGDFIKRQPNESYEVVYSRTEQIFVDMLHAFLAQLPVAAYAYILESPIEEYAERVRLCLGYMCKLELIESHIRFSFPPGANITSSFHAQTSVSCPQQVQDVSTLSPNISEAVLDVGEIQEEEQATEQHV